MKLKCRGKYLAPCVNNSSGLTTIYEKEIYIGLGMIQELEIETIRKIETSKQQMGSFNDFFDFTKRVKISKTQLNLLIRVGAFRFTGLHKKQLLWKSCMNYKEQITIHPELFQSKPKEYDIPELPIHKHEDTFDELELIGFPVSSPFTIIEKLPKEYILVKDMKINLGRSNYDRLFCIRKSTKTSNGKIMYFGTFIDENGAFLDTIHFPLIAEKFPFKGIGVYK